MGTDIAALAGALGVQRPRVWQSMFIFKQPEIGGEVRWHQDATYLIAEPLPVTGLWFALEDATVDNGCLWVQPGGHRGPLRERFVRSSSGVRLDRLDHTPWPTTAEAVPLEVKAGAVVCFHGLMPHYSAPNRSAVSRLAYTLHLSDERSRWSADNWLRTGALSLLPAA
jgi:phytanoyl-CoA hydroxylase